MYPPQERTQEMGPPMRTYRSKLITMVQYTDVIMAIWGKMLRHLLRLLHGYTYMYMHM